MPFELLVDGRLDLNIPAMIWATKGGRVELTLLAQAIKVLSYTQIQAIMKGVEEIQMSKKKRKEKTAMMMAMYLLGSELFRLQWTYHAISRDEYLQNKNKSFL